MSRRNQDAGELRKPSSVSPAPKRRTVVIPLGPALPPASSNLPGSGPAPRPGRARRRDGQPARPLPYLVLLRMGFSLSSGVAAGAVRSYRTISPLPPPRRAEAVCFLLHCPSRRRASPLASMPPVGARTFLSGPAPEDRPERAERPRRRAGRCKPGETASRKVRAPQDAVVGNTHRPRGSGQCHRKYTATPLSSDVSSAARGAVRVKWCGKSAPRRG